MLRLKLLHIFENLSGVLMVKQDTPLIFQIPSTPPPPTPPKKGFFSDLGHQIAKTILTSATNLTDSALSFLHNKTATAALRKHIDTHGHELREIDSNGNFIPPPPPLLVSVAGGVGELGRAEKALRTLVKMGFTSYAIVGSVYDIMTTLTYASYIAYDSIMMDSKEAFLMM